MFYFWEDAWPNQLSSLIILLKRINKFCPRLVSYIYHYFFGFVAKRTLVVHHSFFLRNKQVFSLIHRFRLKCNSHFNYSKFLLLERGVDNKIYSLIISFSLHFVNVKSLGLVCVFFSLNKYKIKVGGLNLGKNSSLELYDEYMFAD